MARATRGPVRLHYGCWGLTITPLSDPLKTAQPSMRFIMSVPKRVLRLAVWRNQARRVAREAWAAACRQSPHLLRQSYSIMLRLTQKPADRVDTLNVQSNATVIGAAKIKAVLRQDCDALLVQLLQRLSV